MIDKKILILYFGNYSSKYFDNIFHDWNTPSDLDESIVQPFRKVFKEVIPINYYSYAGDCGIGYMNSFIAKTISDIEPDYVFWCTSGHEISIPTLKYVRHHVKSLIALSFDDAYRAGNYVSRLAGMIDVLLFNDPAYIDYYAALFNHSFFIALPGASGDVYHKITGLDKIYDVSFVGSFSPYRKEIIDYLSENGISVHTFGAGWNNSPYVGTPDKVNIFNRSKINLNLESFPKKTVQIKGRVFEVSMTGNFLITERFAGIDRIFREDENIVAFGTKEELLKKIRHYLGDDRARIEIEGKMRKYALENLVSECVVEKTFRKIGDILIRKNRSYHTLNSLFYDCKHRIHLLAHLKYRIKSIISLSFSAQTRHPVWKQMKLHALIFIRDFISLFNISFSLY